MTTIYTIGHSNHSVEAFVGLLQRHAINTLVDVRSSPYSRLYPQFAKESLARSLEESGLAYLFLGRELGARASDPNCYDHGKVSYERLARTPQFERGIARLLEAAVTQRVALMCAEKDPLTCHRTILVARALEARGVEVIHILADGELESETAAMARLLDLVKLPQDDLFMSREELIAKACEIQGAKIAYVNEDLAPSGVGFL